MHVAADHHGVHDREDLGALVVVHLGRAVVGIEPHDIGIAAERLRHAGADDGLQLAVLQHLAQRLAGRVGADRHFLGGRQDGRIAVGLGAVDVALDPFVLGEIDAVLVAQQPADEDRRGHGVDRHADALAFEVLRRLDVLLVDEDEAVPEHARGEHRNGDERTLPGDEARDVFGAENSAASNSSPAAMRSKMLRGLSSTRKLRSTPSTCTSPVWSACMRS